MRKGHPKFYKLLKEIEEIHDKKNADYAKEKKPLSNLRLCEEFGIPGWRGCLVRMSDKWSRLTRLANKGKPAVEGETIVDTLKDLAVYALLCVILLEDEK